ncbi:MAG: hypothetical protein ACHQFW_09580 [Chitinophagales bacterium]
MKKVKSIILMAVVILAFASCAKEDVPTPSVPSLTDSIEMAKGSWIVNYYYDNSNGVSNDFDGWTFSFNADGTIIVASGAESFSGSWVVENSDDDPNFDTEMVITISGNTLMDKLDHKWLITELTDSTMHLKDDSGNEEIHFEKI